MEDETHTIDIFDNANIMNVYETLIRIGGTKIDELSEITKLSKNEVKKVIEKLEELGFVFRVNGIYYPMINVNVLFESLTQEITKIESRILDMKNSLDSSVKSFSRAEKTYVKEIETSLALIYKVIASELTNLESMLKGEIESVKKATAKMNNLIETRLHSMETEITTVIDSLERIITEYNNVLDDTIKRMVDDLRQVISEIKREVRNKVKDIIENFEIQWSQNINSFNTFLDESKIRIEKDLESLKKAIINLKELFTETLTSYATYFHKMHTDMKDILSKAKEEAISKIEKTQKELHDIIINDLNEVLQAVHIFLGNVKRSIISSVDSVSTLVENNIDEIFNQLTKEIEVLNEALSRHLDTFQNEMMPLEKEFVENIAQRVLENENKFGQAVRETDKKITTATKIFSAKLNEKIKDINEIMVKHVESSINSLAEIVRSYEKAIRKELDNLYADVLAERKELFNYFNEIFSRLKSKIGEMSKVLSELKKKIIEETATKIVSRANEIAKQIDVITDEYALKFQNEVQEISKDILKEFERDMAQLVVGFKRNKDEIVSDLFKIMKDIENLRKSVKTVAKSTENVDLTKINSGFTEILKDIKNAIRSVENLGIAREDELERMKYQVDLFIHSATNKLQTLLSQYFSAFKSEMKKYISARSNDLQYVLSKGFEDMLERISREISWHIASYENALQDLKDRVERSDQKIASFLESILKKSVDIGTVAIKEREKICEALQGEIRNHLYEFKEDFEKTSASVTESLRALTKDMTAILDEYLKGVKDESEKFVSKISNQRSMIITKITKEMAEIFSNLQTLLNERATISKYNVKKSINNLVSEISGSLARHEETTINKAKTIMSTMEERLQKLALVHQSILKDLETELINQIEKDIAEKVNNVDADIKSIGENEQNLLGELSKIKENWIQFLDGNVNTVINNIEESIKQNINRINSLITHVTQLLDTRSKEEIDSISDKMHQLYQYVNKNLLCTTDRLKETTKHFDEILNETTENLNQIFSSLEGIVMRLRDVKKVDDTLRETLDKEVQRIIDGVKNTLIINFENMMSDTNKRLDAIISIVKKSKNEQEKVTDTLNTIINTVFKNIKNASISFGSDKIWLYLDSIAEKINDYIVIFSVEEIPNIEKILNKVKIESHVELIMPKRFVEKIISKAGKPIAYREPIVKPPLWLIVYDDKEVFISLKGKEEKINISFQDPEVVKAVKNVLPYI